MYSQEVINEYFKTNIVGVYADANGYGICWLEKYGDVKKVIFEKTNKILSFKNMVDDLNSIMNGRCIDKVIINQDIDLKDIENNYPDFSISQMDCQINVVKGINKIIGLSNDKLLTMNKDLENRVKAFDPDEPDSFVLALIIGLNHIEETFISPMLFT